MKYENLKYDNWVLMHGRQRFELKGRIVDLPENIGDKYPKLLKKVKEQVVMNINEPEIKNDENIVLGNENISEKIEDAVIVNDEKSAEEIVEEPVKKSRKRKNQ